MDGTEGGNPKAKMMTAAAAGSFFWGGKGRGRLRRRTTEEGRPRMMGMIVMVKEEVSRWRRKDGEAGGDV